MLSRGDMKVTLFIPTYQLKLHVPTEMKKAEQ